MKETNITTDLYCTRCQSDTPHRITYLNGCISHIECEHCARSYDLEVDVKHELYHELLNRIKSKPSRITQEYKGNLTRFLLAFPRKAVRKPYRLLKEAKEVKQLVSKYSKK